MRPPRRPVLLGTVLAALLALAAGGAWLAVLAPQPAGAAGDEPLPLPPEPPRVADGPEYERCLAQARTDPEGARQAAEAWEAAGGGDGARHCLGLALLGVGEAERAGERLEALAARGPGGAAARAAVFSQAVQAWTMANRADRAFAAATQGLILTPADVELLTDRALALGALNRPAEAIGDLDRVLALDPERAEALVLRAAANRRLDRAGPAERDVAQALRLAPDNAEALLERGIQRQMRGDGRGARADWERAIALAPDSRTAELAEQNLALSEAGPPRR